MKENLKAWFKRDGILPLQNNIELLALVKELAESNPTKIMREVNGASFEYAQALQVAEAARLRYQKELDSVVDVVFSLWKEDEIREALKTAGMEKQV